MDSIGYLKLAVRLVLKTSKLCDNMQQLKQQILNKRTLLSFLISFTIIYYIFSKINISELINTLEKINMFYFMIAFLCFYISILLKSIRWKVFLKNTGTNITLMNAFIIYYLSMFANSLVPAKMGDVYRGYLLKKKTKSSISLCFGTVFIERIFDLITMMFLLVICGYLSFKDGIPLELLHSLKYGIIIIILLMLVVISIVTWNKKFIKLINNGTIKNIMINFEKGLRTVNIRTLPILIVLSYMGWIIEGFTVYFIFLSLNIDLGVVFGIFSDLSSSLLTAIPLTPSGLGIVEYAMVYILKLKGIVESYALAVLMLYRTVSYLSIIIMGAILNMIYKN